MMGNEQYIDYMQSASWDRKRKERLKHDDYTCQECGEKNKPLDVHHLTYERFGNEHMDDIESLCRRCHEIEHGKRPLIIMDLCRTCSQMLPIFIQKIKLLGTIWTQYQCQDGHIRSYKD